MRLLLKMVVSPALELIIIGMSVKTKDHVQVNIQNRAFMTIGRVALPPLDCLNLPIQPIHVLIAVDGVWGTWNPWQSCSRTCGRGLRHRIRYCNAPAPQNGGRQCRGDGIDFEDCNHNPCNGENENTGVALC